MVKIKIPATSANLGPGFDALGLALNMYNEVHMQEIEGCDICLLYTSRLIMKISGYEMTVVI